MSDLMSLFIDGGATSTDVDRQTRDEFVTKAVVEMPKRKIVFGKLSNRVSMPKNHGDTLTREVAFPMLDSRNLVDGNVDATTATIIQDVWYHTNAAGSLIAVFDSKDYLVAANHIQEDARALAKAAAVASVAAGAPTDKLKSGAGGMVNGMASYAATTGPLVTLPEEGGVVNLLSSTSKHVSAKVTFHGVGTKFSMRSVDLDSRPGLIGRHIKDLGDAVADLKEMQVRHDLLAAGHANAMLSVGPTNASTITIDELDGTDVLTYDTLTAMEQELLRDDVPMQVEMLTGVDLQDTVTVNDGWIVYVNNEVLPTLRRMTGPGGVLVWQPVRQYAADKNTVEGEQGAIGSFRFVTVKDMERQYGAGEQVGGANDAATAAEQSAAFKTIQAGTANAFYDVFTALIVGDDSFSITGFGSNSTKAKYLPPVADVHNDMHAQMAGVSANWSYGMLIYRSERIKSVLFTLSRI